MLQAALLLLGCALSRYLWEINITVASIVLGVTSFGIAFYFFIVVASTVSDSCPYQTPGSHVLRYLGPRVQNILRSSPSAIPSGFRKAFQESEAIRIINKNVQWYYPWWSRGNIMPFFTNIVRGFPRALATDVYRLGRVVIRPLVAFVHRVCDAFSTLERVLDQHTTVLDLRCISWMLQTSLDDSIRLSTLKYLMTVAVFPDFDPTLVADCFNLFIGCINVRNHKVAITHESEELATVSAMCFFRTFHHLSVADPTSSVLTDLRQRYNRIFPFGPEFKGLPFYSTMAKIHDLLNLNVQWGEYRPSAHGHVSVARDMAEAARVEYQTARRRKVPRWILRFTLRSLSLDPLPPIPAVANCLSISAIDLGCDVSNIGLESLDEK